jgi:membrane-bound serine protease (ClpP class)
MNIFLKLLIISFILSAYPNSTAKVQAQTTDSIARKMLVYKLNIKTEIGPAIWRQTMQAMDQAEKKKADFILIHLNTYGGLVDAADSIRTKILNSPIPVLCFIDNNAASAGALIAIACDSIYMRPGANIGAATVVNQTGEPVPDKFQSYMRSIMRATAEAHGQDTIINGKDTTFRWFRDPNIAEAMVDPDKYIKGVIDTGKVLTFTANEAKLHHFCEGIAENVDEVLKKAGITNYEIFEYKPTALEKVIGYMVNPFLQGILIMIIIAGIYYELQTPGIGFPLAAAALAAILYFAPLYLEGIAEHWEILIFIIGLILLLIEIFVLPGFGIAGISGIILAILGLALSMAEGDIFNFDGEFSVNLGPFIRSLFVVMVSMFLAISLSIVFSQRLVRSSLFNTIALNRVQNVQDGFLSIDSNLEKLVGKQGKAYTFLRPSGKIEVDGEIYDAKALTGFIDEGKTIEIVKLELAQFYVKEVQV